MAKHTIFLTVIYVLLCGCVPKQPAPAETPAPQAERKIEAKGPPLIARLRYVKDDSLAWVIRTGFIGQNGAIPMRYMDTRGFKNNAGAANPVMPGDIFFPDGPAAGRFKFIGVVQERQMNPAINVEEVITIAVVEDQKPNKQGMVYEIPAPLTQARQARHIQHDRSAVMVFEWIGQGGKVVVVEENTRFALPFDAKTKDYLLKSVTPDEIVVEYTDAKRKRTEVTIKKGQLPVMDGDGA